jgi:hypothetical protein
MVCFENKDRHVQFPTRIANDEVVFMCRVGADGGLCMVHETTQFKALSAFLS